MARQVTIPYSPRDFQRSAHDTRKRWLCMICHRRAGKTVFAVNEMIKTVMTCKHENPRAWYIAPFYTQAKRIAWDELKKFSRPIPGIKINESELRIDYPNGGRVTLLGADNADAIRGTYSDLTILDEYAQIAPNVFPEVVRPTLSDRSGRAIFCGTPKGQNHFFDLFTKAQKDSDWYVGVHPASETAILPQEELDSARSLLERDMYDQEYECSWTAAIQGSYYSEVMKQAREGGRITRLPVETSLPVHTAWDLGRNDTTAIWFFQASGKELRFIDCYENNGEGLDHYARVLKERGYFYGDHYLPHDVEITELTTNLSRRETLEQLGVRPITTVDRVRDVNEGIEQTRQMFARCWFDEAKCKDGLRALENYRKEWDDKRQAFRSRPLHDWSSNYADSFRQIAQGYREQVNNWAPINYPQVSIA